MSYRQEFSFGHNSGDATLTDLYLKSRLRAGFTHNPSIIRLAQEKK